MLVLGLNLSHDASAALVTESGVLCCVQEERLDRVKFSYTFPERAIAEVLRLAGAEASQIEAVAWTSIRPLDADYMRFLLAGNRHTAIDAMSTAEKARLLPRLGRQAWIALAPRSRRASVAEGERLLADRLRSQFGITAPAKRYGHHTCHASSAYYTSGFEKALVVTSDGAGDEDSGSISLARDGRLLRTASVLAADASVGAVYSEVTRALGFKPNRHEGKITGLAAHGDPDATLPSFRALVGLTEDGCGIAHKAGDWSATGFYARHPGQAARFILPRLDHFWKLSHYHWLREQVDALAARHSREDMAAGVQAFTEEILCAWVSNAVRVIGPESFDGQVAMAGGVFANVRVNACLAELPWARQTFIHPNMGDGGLSVGAAFLRLAETVEVKPQAIPHVYLGPEYNEREIEGALRAADVAFERPADLEEAVVDELMANRVVARFAGAMEYGPRALGNRSILYAPTDPTINDWLNKKLQRTEFMPFAPSSLEDLAEASYEHVDKSLHAARFMTVAYRVTSSFAEQCPAVVHVDQTARPQLVSARTNPGYEKILRRYHERTGIPAVLNTSFNMHEEPIVASPEDAIRAYQLGHLDRLAIGPFLCRQEITR